MKEIEGVSAPRAIILILNIYIKNHGRSVQLV